MQVRALVDLAVGEAAAREQRAVIAGALAGPQHALVAACLRDAGFRATSAELPRDVAAARLGEFWGSPEFESVIADLPPNLAALMAELPGSLCLLLDSTGTPLRGVTAGPRL